jgi:hypothetical protein
MKYIPSAAVLQINKPASGLASTANRRLFWKSKIGPIPKRPNKRRQAKFEIASFTKCATIGLSQTCVIPAFSNQIAVALDYACILESEIKIGEGRN